MDWFFVIGLSVEISGAVLIAGEVLFASRRDIAARGAVFPGEGGNLEAQRGAAMTWVGVVLVAIGFFLQLSGYVIAADDYWFFAIAVAVIAVATAGGLVASRGLARVLRRVAVRNAPRLSRPPEERGHREGFVKRRAWVFLIGLPLVAVVLGVVWAVLWSLVMGLVLVVCGLLVSATNYQRLKAMSTPDR
jgi:hypothetical protein